MIRKVMHKASIRKKYWRIMPFMHVSDKILKDIPALQRWLSE